MCGRYSTGQLSLPSLAEQFQADATEAEGTEPNWNVTPTSQVLVVTAASEGSEGARRLRKLRWGLVPSWAKELKVGNKMINVRAETVADKPTFKRLLASKRCILPADGFYEWQDVGPEPGRKRPRKQPFYITTRDGAPLALAGLWTTNRQADPDGPVETCTILTTSANKLMSSIHHRMPVILPESAWDTWLDPDVDAAERLTALLVPAPDDLLMVWPVDQAVSSPRSNGPELTRPLEGHEPRTAP
jgi:putative SOS response-associated peptidase YedK